MEFSSIFAQINETAESLTEKDLDDVLDSTGKPVDGIVSKVATHLNTIILGCAKRAYGTDISEVARRAFVERAKGTIRTALKTFLFTKEHWRSGRDINSYLLVCINRLADEVYWDQSSSKRTNVPVCPGCRDLGHKVFLVAEGKAWRCPTCTAEAERLGDDDRKGRLANADAAAARARMRLHRFFALHSRKGYRCPESECSRFIPDSLRGEFGIACPYGDCDFVGDAEGLQEMAHPTSLGRRQVLSLNNSVNKNDDAREFVDLLECDSIRIDDQIAIIQRFKQEYKTLMSVIDAQMASVKLMNSNATREQKLLMYEAFKKMCESHPEEMVSYLVHQSQSQDFPLQARIFQTFVSLVEDSLPFTIEKHGEEIEIMSISDPDLGLFTGTSEFDAVVQEEGIIPNNTIETYTGSRKYKNHGSYYIGRLVDVVNTTTGGSLLGQVKSHSFIEIETSIPVGTKVRVTHYRIPPHYEMGAMVFLQRIRRHIVDKVYFRINGVKRQPGRRDEAAISAA